MPTMVEVKGPEPTRRGDPPREPATTLTAAS